MRKNKKVYSMYECLDYLIAYEAYCICTGYDFLSLPAAMDNKSTMSVIKLYYGILRKRDNSFADNDIRKFTCDTIRTMSYGLDLKSFAYAFIKLNAYLQHTGEKACVLSWYDLCTIIELISGGLECVDCKENTKVRYILKSDSARNKIRNILVKSIYSKSEAINICRANSLRMALSVMFTSKDCCIDTVGLWTEYSDAQFIYPRVEFSSLSRGTIVYRNGLKYDCFDAISALLYSLNVVSEETYSILPETTIGVIERFIAENFITDGFCEGKIIMAMKSNTRALDIDGIYIMSVYSPSDNSYTMTAVCDDYGFSVNLEARKFLGSSGYEDVPEETVKAIGEILNKHITQEEIDSLRSVIRRTSVGSEELLPSNRSY